ncbi:MAG: PAS domain S-box protein [Chitinivibrionales bacterium]|nr:PAS domain S-box protein [Chitinivibrionales bacterium]
MMGFGDWSDETTLEGTQWCRAIAGRIGIGLFVVDMQGGIVDANDAMLRMLGYGRDELPAVSPSSLILSDESIAKAYECREQALRYGATTAPFVFRLPRKDGGLAWVEIECNLLRGATGEPAAFLCTAIDITRTIRAEERESRLVELLGSLQNVNRQLREIHDRLEHAVSGGELGAWDWSVSSGLIECNPQCKHMLGFAPDELQPSFDLWRELVHPDDKGRLGETVNPLLAGEVQSFELEHRLRHKSGEWVWVVSKGRTVEQEPGGRPVRISGTLLDISERKRAEEELRLSKERYATYMRLTADGIYRIEFDQPVPIDLPSEEQVDLFYKRACVAEANDALARMHGYPRGEALKGKRLEEFHGGRYVPANRDFLRRFVQNNRRVEDVLSHEVDRDGREHYFRNTVFGLVEDGHLVRVWGTQHDITELIATQDALRESEERFRRLAESIRLIPWESDIASERFTYVGPRAEEILGYPLEQWREPGFWEAHIAPEDRGAAVATCRKRIEEGHTDYSLEYRLITAGGGALWVLDIANVIRENGSPVTLRGFLIDITLQKQAQEQLRRHARELARQRRLTRKIFDTNPNILYVLDLEKKELVFRNRYITHSLGYTMEQLRGLLPNVSDQLMYPADRPRFAEYLAAMRTAGDDEIRSFEYRMRALDGSWHWFLSWDTPFERAGDGFVSKIIGAAVDVTDLKNAQADLEQYQHRLEIQNEQLSHMNASLEDVNRRLRDLDRMKSDFVSIASHELRTPVTSVLAFTQVLLSADETISPQSRHTYLQMIEREARRLGVLAADLLDISKIESGRSELRLASASLPSIAAEVIAGLAIPPDRRVSLHSDEAGEQPIVCDPGRIRQVFGNLIENATRYGTEIQVAITGDAAERRVDVIDNGPGIAPEELPRIFGKFYRVRSDRAPGKGSGLGLAIAKDIVEAHGGKIWAESTVGKGSAFHFTLSADLVPGERAASVHRLQAQVS